MKKLKAVGAGLLVVAIGASLSGTLQSLLSFAFISIICTLGIAFFVWILLLYLIGSMALASIGAIAAMLSERGKKEESASEHKESVLREQIAIERYIDRSKSYGLSHEQILSALKNVGWSDAAIQAAYGGHQRP